MIREDFILKANIVHNNKYVYNIDKDNLTNKDIIKAICKEHGAFDVKVFNHLHHKSGCPKCRAMKSSSPFKSNDELIVKLNNALMGKYEYANVDYKSKHITLICHHHGYFIRKIKDVLRRNASCDKCKSENCRAHIVDVRTQKTENKVAYNKWNNILIRCYNVKYQEKMPSYIGCTISDDWKFFDNFLEWFNNPENGYRDGYHLDKDILIQGNKEYAPDKCCFVPPLLNSMLTRSERGRGTIKSIGVILKGGKFVARCNYGHKEAKTIGSFNTEQEAFDAYKEAKENYIKSISKKMFEDGDITQKVYNALLKYEVKQY